MSEPINFNRIRKAKAKGEAQAKAAENRVTFGRSKVEKLGAKLEVERARMALDQTKRED